MLFNNEYIDLLYIIYVIYYNILNYNISNDLFLKTYVKIQLRHATRVFHIWLGSTLIEKRVDWVRWISPL